MTIASTVQRYLAGQGIELCESEPSAHRLVFGDRPVGPHLRDCIAKTVVLRDGVAGDGYLLAVVPASHHLDLDLVRGTLGRSVALASEQEIGRLFPDCDLGAIPPLGPAYGLDVVLDDSLAGLDEVCFEGGDHRTLVRVGGEQFRELMSGARHGRFSSHD